MGVLSDKAEEIIKNAVQTYFLSSQKPRVSKLRQIIALEAYKAGLPCPSRKAIDLRIKSIDPRTFLAKREGTKAANDKTRPVTGCLQAARPLEIVQVDHTKIDVIVVDEKHRLPIQRPWLTLLIDVTTRMVAGYYLSLEAPSSVSVALALQHAVLPKDEWLSARGIGTPWPVLGLPELLHMDNGKEFHAKALRRGADEYGIKLFYRPVATPHYGGHIERLIGTMMGEVHLLPGTTFSDIAERGAYDSERHAMMTLKELDHWLAIQIVGRYHQQIHRSLARPPIAVWEELALSPDFSLRRPQDEEHFFCDFLPYTERKIGRDGVSLFGIKYWDSVLSVWAGISEQKFVVRYDPRDLSAVYVQSADEHYWKVRYCDLCHPSITLWEHKLARKSLIEQGKRELNERMLFDAIEAQRLLVEESSAKTKSARRYRQRVAEALPLKKATPQRIVVEPKNNDHPSTLPVLPYEIEEWS
ncbi:MAG: Mu transposase C-terminal domain-containing protein [Rhodomicrobium sp.]